MNINVCMLVWIWIYGYLYTDICKRVYVCARVYTCTCIYEHMCYIRMLERPNADLQVHYQRKHCIRRAKREQCEKMITMHNTIRTLNDIGG